MELNNENKTLFIPLYGKALMSKENLFIKDPKAEEIINNIDFNFDELKQTKWLSMYLAIRSRILDDLCSKFISENPDGVIINLGCGLDSRVLRVNQNYDYWYDVDFPSVISLRRNYYEETDRYTMLSNRVEDIDWLDQINKEQKALIIAEGLTMYLDERKIKNLLGLFENKFVHSTIIFDAYSKSAVTLSKIKNPVNQMNAKVKWGMDDEDDIIALNKNIKFIASYPIRCEEEELESLDKMTRYLFEKLYCGKCSESLYKIYEFRFNM